MMTVISYARAKYSSSLPPLKLVWAGHEPREFVNFFPEWIVNDFVAKSNEEVGCLSPVQGESEFRVKVSRARYQDNNVMNLV